jgi:putative NADH-flavin reductase
VHLDRAAKYESKEDAMKVPVIGAAGKSGEALVNEALVAGHKVTAFVRGAAQ